MDSKHKRVIIKNLTDLTENTRLEPLLEQKLMEKNVFTAAMIERIKNECPTRRVQRLYEMVQSRGPDAFQGLLQSLQESGHLKAARILDPSVAGVDSSDRAYPGRQSKVWNEAVYTEQANNGNTVPYTPPPIIADSTQPIVVSVRRNIQAVTCNLAVYPMQSKPRGYCLIIDNEVFDSPKYPTRTGSGVDANNLDILFEQLDFKVTLRKNLGYQFMRQEIANFSRKPELQKADMLIVCVLSHGVLGHMVSSDGREIETEWILRQFNNDGCPALKGKPKFFILQACRGDETDYGTFPERTLADGHEALDAKRVDDLEFTAQVGGGMRGYKDPSWEDMLIAYATLPGYVANRDLYRGTWFVEALVQIFMDRACDMSLRDMLDMVSQRLRGYESERGTKQSFAYEVRHFYKKLFFNPRLSNE